MEFHDEMPVTGYEVRLAGRTELDRAYGEKLYKGNVVVLVVACTVDGNKAEYVLRKEDEGEKVRRYVLNVEDLVPLKGEMRDQAIVHLSYGGLDGVIDFGTPTDAEVAVDHLRQYITKSWPAQLPENVSSESLVKAAIEQLENYLSGVAPRPLVEEDDPFAGVLDVIEEINAQGEAEVQPDEAESSRPDGEVQDGNDGVAEPEPPAGEVAPGQAIDVAAIKASMVEPERPSGLKLARMEEAADGVDADGYPVTMMDDVERVGSVYPPGHGGKDQAIIERALADA